MRTKRITRTSVVATGIAAVAFAVVCWTGALGAYRRAVALRDHGVETTATVISVHPAGDDSYARIAFTTRDGRRVETDMQDYRADPAPLAGDLMQVRYARTEPDRYVQDARQAPDFVDVWIQAGGGLFVLSFGSFLVYACWPRIGERWP